MTKNENKQYSKDYKDYKFEKDNIIGSIVVKKPVSASQIESVIVNSFEGGSNYWLGLNNSVEGNVWNDKPKGLPWSTWATQMLLEGKTLHFCDEEDGSEQWTLNLEQLVKGVGLNYELRTWDNNIEDGDASTADCILQYGIFGEIVYG